MPGIAEQSELFKETFCDLAGSDIFTLANNPDVIPLVSFGSPGTERPDDIVCFQGLRSTQDPAALSTTRTREEAIELDVIISVFRGGAGDDIERAASKAAYGYLSQLEEYVRTTDTTVGGTVRYCFLDRTESEGWTVGDTGAGRNITLIATFGAKYRIR